MSYLIVSNGAVSVCFLGPKSRRFSARKLQNSTKTHTKHAHFWRFPLSFRNLTVTGTQLRVYIRFNQFQPTDKAFLFSVTVVQAAVFACCLHRNQTVDRAYNQFRKASKSGAFGWQLARWAGMKNVRRSLAYLAGHAIKNAHC
ncbi:TPA: hypothetical protein ACGRVO_004553 [Escherichia coli]